MGKEKLKERARDELFSHINRCGVLQAEREDQRTWMDETIEYIGERYPELADGDLRELHEVGMRFCKPAIPHGEESAAEPADEESAGEASGEENAGEPSEEESAA